MSFQAPCRLLRSAILVAALLCLFLTGCSRDRSERFPPYDNTEEVKAFYDSKPDFFKTADPATIPKDLKWITGLDEPEIGSPKAKKGGTLHWFSVEFPSCIRHIGPGGNNTFRSDHYDDIKLFSVMPHPNTGNWMPGVCREWAISPDHRTVYFHIDPEARFNTGNPVRTEDFKFCFYLGLSPYAQDPYRQNQFSTKYYSGFTTYDDLTYSVTLSEPRADPVYFARDVEPFDHIFYKDFGPDFTSRYQWIMDPTTGAYEIRPEDINKGTSITMRRLKNWWAKDRKFYRHRFNPDFIHFDIFNSPDKGFEACKAGKLDFFQSYLDTMPEVWHQKIEAPPYHNGYIEKAEFYNDWPLCRGLHINTALPPLDNLDFRVGIQHAMNIQKVIEVELKGDATRLNTYSEGYGRYSNHEIRAREFSPEKAAAAFAKAGYSQRGADGIFHKPGKPDDRATVALTIRERPNERRYALRLKEEAKKAGLDLKIDAVESTSMFQKVLEKKHQMCLLAWVMQPPYPQPWQGYHSTNAYDKKPDGTRTIKTSTNNLTSTADPEMDALIDKYDKAGTLDELASLYHQIEQRIYDLACFVPAWETPFHRCIYWRWVRWPDDYNVRISLFAAQYHVFWIDEDMRRETLEAMRTGKTFPEVSKVYEQYRTQD
jgi:microcin C transport system substrate-binding protein